MDRYGSPARRVFLRKRHATLAQYIAWSSAITTWALERIVIRPLTKRRPLPSGLTVVPQVLSRSGLAILLEAQYLDAESGLMYAINRYYDPQTAQWLTRDPLVLLTKSAYGYVGDDPLNAAGRSGQARTTADGGYTETYNSIDCSPAFATCSVFP